MGYSIGSTGRLKASYRYILAEYEDGSYSGQSIGLVPKHLGTLSYTQKFGNKSSIGIVSKYTGQQTYDASPSVPASKTKVPSYFLTDISIQQSYSKSLEVSLTVKNLFDKRYSTYGGYGYVIVGDNAVGSSSYYHFPSDPRSIYISVTGHF
ncbi:MAG: TonB-dependent receptor domain-containing protein [Burkholderiaceae bacterium]